MTTALNRIATAVTDQHHVDKQINTQIENNVKKNPIKSKNYID